MKTETDIFMENVVHLRRAHGLSRRNMAEILGIGVKSLHKIERGVMPPRLRVDVLFRIQTYFNLSPAALFQQMGE